ncbi:ATP-binding response regulator [Asticcacaulis tiandongensis]|uniref:ATP-binding response regulator n=1 Tax=Asticcacaulis tiandongensis TaxID=2565365 RepID=UPI00112AA76F|nr:ATP-binding protein [Asticcacaulis tiandongensis]
MKIVLVKVEIRYEQDVVLARRRTRQIAQFLRFDVQDQIRIATAVSELARNVYQYTSGGRVEFSVESAQSRATSGQLIVTVSDRGRGIANLKEILAGDYRSKTGMGLGIMGARRLTDHFDIETGSEGTVISIRSALPRSAPEISGPLAATLSKTLMQEDPQNPFEEMQKQNQELLAALDEVERQKARLTELNVELEETNQGVMALSGELEQRANFQKRASELKSEFLSNITHELRTPLNSIISISGILLERLDGDLTSEQEKQIGFIQNSARGLSELVNDVLDLAKVEAGKVTIRTSHFEVSDVFRVLRGMLRPLLKNDNSVELVFEDMADLPMLETDEDKVSQILRNFISNSLKFTCRGEVRVSVETGPDDTIIFSVRDTGIGIAEADQERIFGEFTQVEGSHQSQLHGTGLGLPLSLKLAQLLGGDIRVESTVGVGSTFSLILPRKYGGAEEMPFHDTGPTENRPFNRVLIIDDRESDRYILKKCLADQTGVILEAATGIEGLQAIREHRPDVIFLDLVLPDISGEAILHEIRRDADLAHLPVIIHSSRTLTPEEHSILLSRSSAIISKSLPRTERRIEIDRLFRQLHQNLRPQETVNA